jgi:hypothetical protein
MDIISVYGYKITGSVRGIFSAMDGCIRRMYNCSCFANRCISFTDERHHSRHCESALGGRSNLFIKLLHLIVRLLRYARNDVIKSRPMLAVSDGFTQSFRNKAE